MTAPDSNVKQAQPAEPAPVGDEILLQDWTPMSRCLDWRIGRVAWNALGAKLFADGDVPNLAHDSGTHSRKCADLLLRWCEDCNERGTLPDEIVVVEYGMGTGLFLRFLLDAFKARCDSDGLPYYGQLRVYATDVSAAMLQAAHDRGLFADHAERVTLALADILKPSEIRPFGGDTTIDLGGSVSASFSNYALDLMPIDIFRRTSAQTNGAEAAEPATWEAVLVRTWLREPGELRAYTDAPLEQLKQWAARGDAPAIAALGPVYSLLQAELRTFPFDVTTHPDAADLDTYATHLESLLGAGHDLLNDGVVVYHSGGALEAAERVTAALSDEGFALFRDVALHTAELAGVARTYQHFGPTVAAAVNLVQWDHHFADGGRHGVRTLAPDSDGVRDQAVRVLVRGSADLEAAVTALFDAGLAAQHVALVQSAGRVDDAKEALELYREALAAEPNHWGLMVEAAARVLSGGLQPQLAVVIAAKGLAINTEHSADLWTVYGDATWACGDRTTARQSYQYALDVHPDHARAHYGMAYVSAEDGRFSVAFEHLGKALANDRDARIRGDVLQLLDVCLRGQSLARERFWQRMGEKFAK